jgi:hypothetical protein
MKLFKAVNNNEVLYIKATSKEVAVKRLKALLLKKFGRYNITDIRECIFCNSEDTKPVIARRLT